MSEVIDGRDILEYHHYMASVMSNHLKALLEEKKEKIPHNALIEAQGLFSIALDYLKDEKKLPLANKSCDPREMSTSHQLLTDMIKKVVKTDYPGANSALEKLAVAMEILTPDGKTIIIAKETYQTLQKVFEAMHGAASYWRGSHSPYSFGTFDGSDD